MSLRYLFFCTVLIAAATVFADKKGKNKGDTVDPIFALPMPDQLPPAPLPDRPLPRVTEMRAQVQHTVAQQQGIDVSHYQGYIDWEEVAQDKSIKFVYIKATEGSGLVDDFYLRNLYGAKRVGIPVGAYHFFSPSASALTQLENFRSVVDPRQQDLIPIVDVEKRGKGSLAQFQGSLKSFLDGVERMFGVKPIIYTGVNFYAKYLEGRFTGYKFMVARYAEEFPGLSEDVPIVLWQYSSTSYVDGISGHVDKSVFLDRYSVVDIMLSK
ncbi:MAG: glycosyl hydrolase family 25 [Bacteroidaceae bacterium]|nr:glycosyl hydrolase family 25 [Bacteroidaceae bacterium]